ncbi:MAG TPA: hypothetical protein VJI98_00770 [Candidatus Nanoarchaeia archaeon]|nr:hypothetical protein [Candidatus Nanoarchaeia archaeon]
MKLKLSKFCSSLEAGLGGYFIADGVRKVADYISKVDSIRDAVYRAATNITPEVITQANDLASRVNLEQGSLFEIATGVAAIGIAYWMFKEDEIAELRK